MKTAAMILVLMALAAPAYAERSCTNRQSGSVTITTCDNPGGRGTTTCRSWWSGSVLRTSCS
jgi:hypothetical protein